MGTGGRDGEVEPRGAADRAFAGIRLSPSRLNMDLLLTHGYFLDEDAKELQIMRPYAPLGILYLCSHLRAKKYDVEVYDSTFGSFDRLRSLLESSKPAVLGVYANLMTRASVVKVLAVAKNAGWKTVVGGSDPAEYVPEYLDHGADVVVIGEGERTLEELLLAFETGGSLTDIRGIAFRGANGVVRRTPTRTQIADIDAQPWPARDAIDMTVYLKTWREFHGQASLGIITARGCPYRCNWCSRNVFGNTHRRRNPKLVADEVEFLLSRYSPDAMWMADDVFTMNRGWLVEYAA